MKYLSILSGISAIRRIFGPRKPRVDEAYWDLKVGSDTIVIHLQHYLGIMIHPSGLSNATDGELSLLDRAFKVVEKEAEECASS